MANTRSARTLMQVQRRARIALRSSTPSPNTKTVGSRSISWRAPREAPVAIAHRAPLAPTDPLANTWSCTSSGPGTGSLRQTGSPRRSRLRSPRRCARGLRGAAWRRRPSTWSPDFQRASSGMIAVSASRSSPGPTCSRQREVLISRKADRTPSRASATARAAILHGENAAVVPRAGQCRRRGPVAEARACPSLRAAWSRWRIRCSRRRTGSAALEGGEVHDLMGHAFFRAPSPKNADHDPLLLPSP